MDSKQFGQATSGPPYEARNIVLGRLICVFDFIWYFLNPQYQYGPHDIGNDEKIMLGLKKAIQRLESDLMNQARALNQALMFRDKLWSFGMALAQRPIKISDPAKWWITYGESASEVRKIAITVLSQTTSASNCATSQLQEGGGGGGGGEGGGVFGGEAPFPEWPQTYRHRRSWGSGGAELSLSKGKGVQRRVFF
ncbi:hypothetical protein GH714_034906 [Hevea brasiliensis]|uniref:HAT C-terminal dimerisation domain-containing protein n=1 Tax=Hevea brasiliensis TaxID=3981 RepID=A0A6A6N4Q9_HEVBR|nr:hypothetical protein GH714_034906 [Hevea brasiliensis]